MAYIFTTYKLVPATVKSKPDRKYHGGTAAPPYREKNSGPRQNYVLANNYPVNKHLQTFKYYCELTYIKFNYVRSTNANCKNFRMTFWQLLSKKKRKENHSIPWGDSSPTPRQNYTFVN